MVRSSELYTNPHARSAAPCFSLSPSRHDATSCAEICALLLTEDETDTILGRSFAQGIRAIEENLRAHFPNNIYADLDYPTTALLQEARGQADPTTYLKRAFIDGRPLRVIRLSFPHSLSLRPRFPLRI